MCVRPEDWKTMKQKHVNQTIMSKQISEEEFQKRVEEKLHQHDSQTLVDWLMKNAYSFVSEEFNNEILDEWNKENSNDCPECNAPLMTLGGFAELELNEESYESGKREKARLVEDKFYINALYCHHCDKLVEIWES